MINFAIYVDTTNDKAPITQRGRAKQKRADLRLVELGPVITRDGGIPLAAHAYPGNRPDITQFAAMIDLLVSRHTALTAALSTGPGDPAARTPPQTISLRVTVVFDVGQNSLANSRTWPRPSWGSSASWTRIGSPA